jgi:hypothetical protein
MLQLSLDCVRMASMLTEGHAAARDHDGVQRKGSTLEDKAHGTPVAQTGIRQKTHVTCAATIACLSL